MDRQVIATSIEQSHHLMECGVERETADMAWIYWTDGKESGHTLQQFRKEGLTIEHLTDKCCPSWSLGKLMGMLPSFLTINGTEVFVEIGKNKGGFFLRYKGEENNGIGFYGDELIDIVVDAITWYKKMYGTGFFNNTLKETT